MTWIRFTLKSAAGAVLISAALLLSPFPSDGFARNRKEVQWVKPIHGGETHMKAVARMVWRAVDSSLSDEEMFGLSGTAFLATVCSNNCTCRSTREMFLLRKDTLKSMGVSFEDFDGKDEAIWVKIKASLDDDIPVLVWNLFGDHEDALLTGYDLDTDEAFGLGVSQGEGPAKTSLSKWKAGGMWGIIVHRGVKKIDRLAIWRHRIQDIVLMALRPPLEGG